MEPEKITMMLSGLVLGAYAFIFNSILKRIDAVEKESDNCDPNECSRRFSVLEKKQSESDPVVMEIKERLVRIEVILEELRRK